MIRALALDPHAPKPTVIASDGLEVVVERFPLMLAGRASQALFNLLALCNLGPDDANRVAGRIQRVPRWQMVPVLYVMNPGAPGIILPASYRFHLDGLAVGRLDSPGVLDAMRDHALSAFDPAPLPAVGPYQLDRAAQVVRFVGGEVRLTDRESEVLAILINGGDAPTSAESLAGRMLGGTDGLPASVDLARRSVSRLRSKLAGSENSPQIVSERGVGYRVELPPGGPHSV